MGARDLDEESQEKRSTIKRFLPLIYLVFAVFVIGGLWLMRVPQSIILIAIFILFIGMHLFGHGSHGSHGGGCCGPAGGHEHERETNPESKGDKADESGHKH